MQFPLRDRLKKRAGESFRFQRAVVITMVAVRMVKVSVNQIINMITMRNCRMAAVRPVDVFGGVLFLSKTGSALVWIGVAYFDDVLIHMIAMRMVKMSVMQVVHMIAVPHGSVSTIWAMDVGMIGVRGASG